MADQRFVVWSETDQAAIATAPSEAGGQEAQQYFFDFEGYDLEDMSVCPECPLHEEEREGACSQCEEVS